MARMDLLYMNNVQSLTSMNFLLTTLPESPIFLDAQSLEDYWENNLKDPDFKVADKISLALVTNAQLTFPLAHWLAAYEGLTPGGEIPPNHH
jgi:hypothetical protein